MDYDKGLVWALLREGKHSLLKAREVILSDDYLEGTGREVYKFVCEYVSAQGDMPTLPLVQQHLGMDLDPDPIGVTSDVEAPSDWWTSQIIQRRLHGQLQRVAIDVTRCLEAQDPNAALDRVETVLRGIRRENLARENKAETIGMLAPQVRAYYERLKAGERGILTPWPTINDATLGFWPQDLAIFVARTGIGKCISADSLLIDPRTGIPHTIEEVFKDSSLGMVHSWSKEKGIEAREITAKHDTGYKECLRFTLGTGRAIEVTPEHPFLTPEGWRRADSLTTGSSIGIPAKMDFPIEPENLSDAEIDVLAVLLAEGSTSGHHIGFTTTDPEILKFMQRAAEEIGAIVKQVATIDYDFIGRDRRNPVLDLARRHKLAGKKAIEKEIPEAIWRLSADKLSRFLSLVWMCDGYVDSSGPSIILGSEKAIRQLQSLLLRFGVQSSVRYKRSSCNGKYFDSWRLRVYSGCYAEFSRAVLLWGEKGERLRKFVDRRRNPNVGLPMVSKESRADIIARAGTDKKRSEAMGNVASALGLIQFSPRSLFKSHGDRFSVALKGLKAYCDVLGCDDLLWLQGSGIFWDRVEKIDFVGERKIYDLTVAPTSCFVANDILVHNTWATVLITLEAWKAGHRVLFATTEISRVRIAMRMIAAHLRLPYNDFRRGRLGVHVEQKFYQGVDALLGDHGLHVIGGNFDFRIDTFSAALDEYDPEFVILDGAYRIEVEGKSRTEKAATTFDALKRLASVHEKPFVVTTQFNREVKQNIASSAKLESIGLTDVAGWNADIVYALVQTDDMKRDKEMIIKPLKTREGVGDEIKVRWDLDTMSFQELEVKSQGGGDADEYGTGASFVDTNASGSKLEDDDVPF